MADTEFETLLAEYKNNYVLFVTTGQQQYKTAYTTVLAEINKYLIDYGNKNETEKQSISGFLSSFNSTQSGINSMQNNSIAALQDIEKLNSEYETTKGQYQQFFGLCEPGSRGCPHPKPFHLTGNYERGVKIMIALSVLLFIFIFFFIAGYYFQGGGAGAITPMQQAQQAIQQVATATNLLAAAVTPYTGTAMVRPMPPPRPRY